MNKEIKDNKALSLNLTECTEEELYQILNDAVLKNDFETINKIIDLIDTEDKLIINDLISEIYESIKSKQGLKASFKNVSLLEFYIQDLEFDFTMDDSLRMSLANLISNNTGTKEELCNWQVSSQLRKTLNFYKAVNKSKTIYDAFVDGKLKEGALELALSCYSITEINLVVIYARSQKDEVTIKKIYDILKKEDIKWMNKIYLDYGSDSRNLLSYKYSDLYLFKYYMDETIGFAGNNLELFLKELEIALDKTKTDFQVKLLEQSLSLYDLCNGISKEEKEHVST